MRSTASTTSTFSALSSAYSTVCRPSRLVNALIGAPVSAAILCIASAGAAGRLTRKQLPTPFSLLTSSSPPIV